MTLGDHIAPGIAQDRQKPRHNVIPAPEGHRILTEFESNRLKKILRILPGFTFRLA
jgi:hypothetical protein